MRVANVLCEKAFSITGADVETPNHPSGSRAGSEQ